jgi:hypothetical protein
MSLIDRIRAQARPDELRSIEVPEWGEPGAPMVLHHRMVTLGDIEEARRAAPDKPLRQQVELICMKALDAEGKPLFKRIDALQLMEIADPVVIIRIGQLMTKALPPEDAEKN